MTDHAMAGQSNLPTRAFIHHPRNCASRLTPCQLARVDADTDFASRTKDQVANGGPCARLAPSFDRAVLRPVSVTRGGHDLSACGEPWRVVGELGDQHVRVPV